MQHGKFLRSWVFQVAFLAAAGFAVMPSYSGLTKIRTRRRAEDSTHVTARRGNATLYWFLLIHYICLLQHLGEAVRPGRRAGLAEIGGHGLADEEACVQGFPVGGRPAGEGFGRAGGQLGAAGQELR